MRAGRRQGGIAVAVIDCPKEAHWHFSWTIVPERATYGYRSAGDYWGPSGYGYPETGDDVPGPYFAVLHTGVLP